MRLAFVVQRYGLDVNGGAEVHCRMLAERLAARPEFHRVTVFTTCAREYSTWANDYPPGETLINGVYVERFPTVIRRRKILQAVSSLVRFVPHPEWAEWPWLLTQGPVVPSLVHRLKQVEAEYDAFAFFTYLYYPTVVGMRKLQGKRLFIPTAHDEPAIHLRIYRTVFNRADAIAFNSDDEAELIRRLFPVAGKPAHVVGCGVVLPGQGEVAARQPPSPFLLYLGRLAAQKVGNLGRQFARFKEAHEHVPFQGRWGAFGGQALRLVVAGAGDTSLLPDRADIDLLGFVDEARKRELLASCEALVMPSRFESLSLVTLEAWSLESPVLADGVCAVTRGHVERSGGGIVYRGDDEFGAALRRLLQDRGRARQMALAGKRYVVENFAWDKVEDRFIDLVTRIRSAGFRPGRLE